MIVPRIADFVLTAKKKSLHDSQRETPRVKRIASGLSNAIHRTLGQSVKLLKFLDEMWGTFRFDRACTVEPQQS